MLFLFYQISPQVTELHILFNFLFFFLLENLPEKNVEFSSNTSKISRNSRNQA